MSQLEKTLSQILSGRSDSNIRFEYLRNLLQAFGFNLRVKGDHHIFFRSDVEEILNLQPKQRKAKAYQVKQVRNIITKYKLGLSDE